MLRSPARYICQGTSVLAHSASRSGSTSAPPVLCASSIANLDYSQTSALLSCLIDHEKTGVPDDAGTGGQESFNLVTGDEAT